MVDFAKIQELLSTICPHDPEEITPDKHLVNDLDIDSFGLMDLIIAFEREYNIDIPDRDLRLFTTAADIINYIEQRTMGMTMAQAH